MSISSSIRLFPTKIPPFLHPQLPLPKTLIPLSPIPKRLSFFSSISIQPLPTLPCSSTSSPSPPTTPLESLPPNLRDIIQLFQSVPNPKAKYEQLLFYGRKLPPLDPSFKTPQNKVQGCVSQVWVRAYLDHDKNVRFEADSDSVLTKGLAALLVQGLSGRPVEEVLRVSPEFVTFLGLQQSLTPSRNNGFLNMLKLMQNKALELWREAAAEGGGGLDGENEVGGLNSRSDLDSADTRDSSVQNLGFGDEKEVSLSESKGETGSNSTNLNSAHDSSVQILNSGDEKEVTLSESKWTNLGSGDGKEETLSELKGEAELSSRNLGRRGERIRERLERELRPVELEVEDISHQHAGHVGVRDLGSDGETHFNVRIVSEGFEGKSLVKRHRLVYDLLQSELQSGLHALSIVAKTPSEVNG
ncbi:hypothetical protein Sjap_003901 [Stephania japonica]|uniref:Fe-S metabolism associated domain-containing protein n=1 Tax=Stephania japonica TaxID=461633 RepID=A0AAP0KPU2_9MAGN